MRKVSLTTLREALSSPGFSRWREVSLCFLAFFALVPFACWGFVVKAKSRKVRVTALWAVSGILALLLVRALMAGLGLGTGWAWQMIDRFLLADHRQTVTHLQPQLRGS